ncbi:MAG: sulfatase-like hydrolase/transferase [Chitinophagales bacterium]|nr:sulfatase-like hydrolase/transferase [Chitinophagales bacterium]
MKNILVITLSIFFLNSKLTVAQCSLPKPVTVSVASANSCSATLTWSAVAGAAYYKVRYKFKDITGYTYIPDQITGLSYTFNNLLPDTTYKFSVAPFCADGTGPEYKNAQKRTSKTTLPNGLTSVNPLGVSTTLSWSNACIANNYKVRYRATGTSGWTTITGLLGTTYNLTGLTVNTNYDFQVAGIFGANTTKWTATTVVNSGLIPLPPTIAPPKPNIILFVLDDGRYDQNGPNGGPSWFSSPAINSIAEEGINFKYAFPTTSQCAPSRVSIYTGLYAHKHGCIDNNSRRFDGLTLVQQVLKDAGYYTGFIGKFGQFQGDPDGFDWWATSDGNIYTNPTYRINGIDTTIVGHIADTYISLEHQFFNSIPAGKKFMLMFFTRIPHGPTVPRDQDLSLYVNESMPEPDNFSKYQNNYPSYFDGYGHKFSGSLSDLDAVKLQDFQCLNGAELAMQDQINWLTQHNQMDSTMIIYSSDNGFLEGEHKLDAKQIAQEESIRVPMFIRYPAWFPAGTVRTDIQAVNIDIAPTLIEAAQIVDTFDWDGTSLHKLYLDSVKRKYFYYQFSIDGNTPAIRAVRSTQYKYIKHYCTSTTEEFYDLTADPKENTNQINNSAFNSLISSYKTILDSIKTALNDTDPTLINCNLASPSYSKETNEETEEFNLLNVEIYPNPSSDYFFVKFNDDFREDIEIYVTNLLDEKVFFRKMPNTNSFNTLISCSNWVKGYYLMNVKKGGKLYTRKFTIE